MLISKRVPGATGGILQRATRWALSARFRKNSVSLTIVLARQKNPTHHEDERGQFARYLKGENPEGADQVYDGTDGQSPMMRDILEGDRNA